jgi:hypothetical protein
MTRLVKLVAILAVAGCAAGVAAESHGREQKPPQVAAKIPFQIYLAKGEANACGVGCREWIAVEGYFDGGAAERMRAFLKGQGTRKLPIYFHSPGGDVRVGMAIGRLLRERGLTAGVGTTIPRACMSANDQTAACRAAKWSGQAVAAEWRPDGACNSACVYALIGAKVRQVPPTARLGIHSVKLMIFRKYSDGRVQWMTAKQAPSLHKTKASQLNAQLRRYVRDMGVNVMLFDAAAKIPHEQVYYLSRDEIASYGIDRRQYVETPWFVIQSVNNTIRVGKAIVQARGPEHKDYRASIVLLACSRAQRAAILYLRGLASDEVGRPVTATFLIGSHKTRLFLTGAGIKQDAIDNGALFSRGRSSVPFNELEVAATAEAINVAETDPVDATRPPRVVTLSTHGLPGAVRTLRDGCRQ